MHNRCQPLWGNWWRAAGRGNSLICASKKGSWGGNLSANKADSAVNLGIYGDQMVRFGTGEPRRHKCPRGVNRQCLVKRASSIAENSRGAIRIGHEVRADRGES